MTSEALWKEISGLPEDMVRKVEDYVQFLRYVQSKQKTDVDKTTKRRGGTLAGGLISMADDFDQTPDCFKEYL